MKHLVLLLALVAPLVQAGEFDVLYQSEADRNGLDWRLAKAIAIVESNENPRAENRRDPSVGLMQLHCQDDKQGRCINRFNIEGWPGTTREMLFDPATNVRFGVQVLAWNIRTYGLRRGIACYNAWLVCRDSQAEPFINQSYLDKVLGTYRQLAGRAAGGRALSNTGSTGGQPTTGYSSPVTVPTGPR